MHYTAFCLWFSVYLASEPDLWTESGFLQAFARWLCEAHLRDEVAQKVYLIVTRNGLYTSITHSVGLLTGIRRSSWLKHQSPAMASPSIYLHMRCRGRFTFSACTSWFGETEKWQRMNLTIRQVLNTALFKMLASMTDWVAIQSEMKATYSINSSRIRGNNTKHAFASGWTDQQAS